MANVATITYTRGTSKWKWYDLHAKKPVDCALMGALALFQYFFACRLQLATSGAGFRVHCVNVHNSETGCWGRFQKKSCLETHISCHTRHTRAGTEKGRFFDDYISCLHMLPSALLIGCSCKTKMSRQLLVEVQHVPVVDAQTRMCVALCSKAANISTVKKADQTQASATCLPFP